MDLTTAKARDREGEGGHRRESEERSRFDQGGARRARMRRSDKLETGYDEPVGGPPPTPDELAKLQAEVAEAHQVADTLKQREKDSEEKVASLSHEVDRYRKQVARPGITGRVVAVNPGWNFLVVDVGDRRGAVMNAPLHRDPRRPDGRPRPHHLGRARHLDRGCHSRLAPARPVGAARRFGDLFGPPAVPPVRSAAAGDRCPAPARSRHAARRRRRSAGSAQ